MARVIHSPNLAGETWAKKLIRDKYAPLLRRTRDDRSLLNEQWLRYDNLLKARPDQQSYFGRHRANLAIGRRIIENWVTKLKQDLFPDSGKWFSVHAESRDSEDGVQVITALFRREIMEYMRVRRKSGPILRQLVTLGTSPIDIGWRYLAREVPTLERVWDESGGNVNKSREVIRKIVDYVGPTCRPVDLFRWYVYPASVNDVTDLELMFEDTLLDQTTIEKLGKTRINPKSDEAGFLFENLNEVRQLWMGGGDKRDRDAKFQAEKRRLADRGLRSPVETSEDPNKTLVMAKAFWRYAIEEDGGEERWYQVVTAGNDDIPVQLRRVVFWDGVPSYLAPKFVEVWEEFYGYGLPGTFDSLAYLANDVLNQGADALTFSLNPIAAVDPGAVQDMTTIRMRPGAKWLVRNPRQNVQFIEPPKDSAAAAMSSIQQLIALMNDAANVAPFGGGGMLGPRARGRAVQTAGGMAQIAAENLVQVRDVVQGCEDLWLNPMLKKMLSRNRQCLDVDIMLNVTGAQGAALIQRQVSRIDLLGEYSLEWLASTSNYNLQVRGQQMIGFLQQVSQIPPEVLAQENARISLKYLLRSIWSEGLQLPEPERLIEDIQPVKALQAELENELFKTGRPDQVHVSPADNDIDHLKVHDLLLAPGVLEPPVFKEMVEHMQEHLKSLVAKQQMQQMQAMKQMAGMMGGMPPGLPAPGQGTGGGMNPGRPQQTTGPDDLNRGMGRPPGMGGMGGSQGM